MKPLEWLRTADNANYVKKNPDLIKEYQYIALYNYNSGNKAEAKIYVDKIFALDPNDALAKQLKDIMSKPAKPAVTAAK